ncbi:hypothetical protein [Kribbella sp. CA-294648]|uniref:hypothetical protein n=1 Tax=Kribbella sp. CA-294648 TaxID=3239948 RepID=UPI003D8BF20D
MPDQTQRVSVVICLQSGVGGDLDHHGRADFHDRGLAAPLPVRGDLARPRMPCTGRLQQLPDRRRLGVGQLHCPDDHLEILAARDDRSTVPGSPLSP